MTEAGSSGEAYRATALSLALAFAAVASVYSFSSWQMGLGAARAGPEGFGGSARLYVGSAPGRRVQSATSRARSSAAITDPHALLESAAGEETYDEARLPPAAGVRFMGEMQEVVGILETRVSRPGYSGAVHEAAQRVRSFCRHAYRVLGRDPSGVSLEDARTALQDAALLQTRAANSISSIFMTSMRDRKRRYLTIALDTFMASSEAHIAEMRRTLDVAPALANGLWRTGRSGAYEPGRGFPAPWGGAEAEGHHMFGAGAEARYRVASET